MALRIFFWETGIRLRVLLIMPARSRRSHGTCAFTAYEALSRQLYQRHIQSPSRSRPRYRCYRVATVPLFHFSVQSSLPAPQQPSASPTRILSTQPATVLAYLFDPNLPSLTQTQRTTFGGERECNWCVGNRFVVVVRVQGPPPCSYLLVFPPP
ncbi:hypothetical protein FKP32DRAFT_472849 [Trametes sanguinea]|nr:hypothetical protein FKP32DRAFT_472849 [Trametes sanguinea]